MSVRRTPPVAPLKPYVHGFSQRDVILGQAQLYTPLPARSDCFLEFYLEERFQVVNVATGSVHRAPRRVLVGPHSRRREDIIYTGRVKAFTIRFSAIGFRALFGIPAATIRDHAESAEAVLGSWVLELEQRLAEATDEDRCAVAESALLRRLQESRSLGDARLPARIARLLETQPEAGSIARLAALHKRSPRHIERLFEEHVGLTPKLFARVERLRRAMALSRTSPAMDWATIAAHCGYFDQSHMTRDFRALTGETPVGFRSLTQRAAIATKIDGREQHVAFVLFPMDVAR